MNIPDKAVKAACNVYMARFERDPHEPRSERMRAALEAAMREMQADLFWNADDPEECYHSLEHVVDAVGGPSVCVKVQQAVRLPNLWIVGRQDDDGEWSLTEYATEAEADAAFGLVPPPEGEGKP